MKIIFIHPDLGIGGAERLIVDAAVGLQTLGHTVTIYTSYHSPLHSFSETNNGLLNVQVRGHIPQPALLKNKFHLPFAILRNFILSLSLLWEIWRGQVEVDCFVVDQLSYWIPLLQWSGKRVFFYGHFPDQLLTGRETVMKRLYRLPFDYLEEWTTGKADYIVANSEFTKQTFMKTFPSIKKEISVLYPSIRFEAYDVPCDLSDPRIQKLTHKKTRILSINRFERKKKIELAINAFFQLKHEISDNEFSKLQLCLAGGYDPKNNENVEYLKELKDLCKKLGFQYSQRSEEEFDHEAQILFIPSFTENERKYLLKNAFCLVYTPEKEHFGLVPIEAMYSRVPVIACNSGGPLETVLDGKTGFLCPPDPESFASALLKLLKMDPMEKQMMSRLARESVQYRFSLDTFSQHLGEKLEKMVKAPSTPEESLWAVAGVFLIYSLLAFIVYCILRFFYTLF